MGRIRDAWETLLGRDDTGIRREAALLRIETEWTAICTDIAATMESLNRLDARLKKREQRAAKKAKDEPTPPVVRPITAQGIKSRKEALRERVRAMRMGAMNGQLAAENPSGEPPESEEPCESC